MPISNDGTINRDPASVSSGSVTGALAHSGATVGFYGTVPVAQSASYTQTYATAIRTHLGVTVASSASPTLTAVTPFGFSGASDLAIMASAINGLVADVANVKQVLNSILDDLQATGLLR